MIKIGSIVIRCYEFEKMYHFWTEALYYVPLESTEDGWVILHDPKGRSPNISLQKVPEKRTGKRSPFHFDLYSDKRDDEVERLVKIGAKHYPWKYPPDHDYIVLEDPDGNLFCVVQI